MPIGWNGLNMPSNACSMCMPIGRVNFKVGMLGRILSHISLRLYLATIPIRCGIVDSNVNTTPVLSWLGHGPPAYDVY